MSSLDSILGPLAPSFEGEPAEWEDVLHRAGAASVQPGRGQVVSRARLWFAVAVLAAATGMAATPIGRAVIGGSFDRLSGWVGGGNPAPADEAAGFSAANAEAYASFPQGTELRLLMSEQIAGVRFDLLGFRDGPSLCLRLVRADHPDSGGGTYCAPLRELERLNAPLAVVGGASFLVGARCDEGDGCDRQAATRVQSTFGVATEAVTSVELITRGGEHLPAHLAHGAFLNLTSQPTGPDTPKSQGGVLDDLIEQATGATSQGARVTVPVLHPTIVDLSGDHPLPSKVSQLASLPGPTSVDYDASGGSIQWLDRREPRGEALTQRDAATNDMGPVLLARAIKPDPTNSFRIGLTLVRIENEQVRPGAAGETWLCVNVLRPGWGGGLSGFCGSLDKQFGALPFQRSFDGIGGQFPMVSGIASDDVAALKLFFSNRPPEQVPLLDNAFALQVAGVDLPAKLVAYDDQGRVIGIDLVPQSDGIIGLPGGHG